MLYVGHWVWFIVYHENDMYETQGNTHMACSHCPWYNKPQVLTTQEARYISANNTAAEQI
jgi:hypothetical protein